MARDFMFLNCEAGEHRWKSSGGRNAACELESMCCCSVPVHVCEVCGDCDYGDNAEAAEVRRICRETETVNMRAPSLIPPLGWQH